MTTPSQVELPRNRTDFAPVVHLVCIAGTAIVTVWSWFWGNVPIHDHEAREWTDADWTRAAYLLEIRGVLRSAVLFGGILILNYVLSRRGRALSTRSALTCAWIAAAVVMTVSTYTAIKFAFERPIF
jgi:hypothetical protein